MAVIIFLLVTILPIVLPFPTENKLLTDTLTALDRALTFFSSDYSSINVDGLFGLRLGQGQLLEALNLCSKKASCENYMTTLKTLTEKLDDTCSKALPYVEQSDPDYYKRFEETISKPYILPYTPTKFNPEQIADLKHGSNSDYNEDKGDACYSRMMGSFIETSTGRNIPRCNITNACYNMMTSKGTSNYAITHQLLYFMVIEHVDCTEQVENFIHGKNIFDIEKDFCQQIYKQASSLVKNGNVESSSRDLFYEQSVLCSSLGFEDFYKPQWMSMALSWPDKKEGCMKMSFTQMVESAGEGLLENAEKHPDEVKNIAGNIGSALEKGLEAELQKLSGKRTMRKLLREKTMKDGCMAHSSGLAFGTFGSYVHYLVQQLQ